MLRDVLSSEPKGIARALAMQPEVLLKMLELISIFQASNMRSLPDLQWPEVR